MALFALTDAKIVINGTDISDHCRSAQLKIGATTLDATAMSATAWTTAIAGLKSWTLDLELHSDFAAASVDQLLFSLLGTPAIPVTYRPIRNAITTATNPEYWGNVVGAGEYSAGGKVGDIATTTVTLTGTGELNRDTHVAQALLRSFENYWDLG
jgi:hypothetical protein